MSQVSRRAILRAAAVAPVAAVAAPPAAADSAPPVAPMPAPPEKPWTWWYSSGEPSWGCEVFSEEFATREAAMAFLEREGEGRIAECQRQDFDLSVNASHIIDQWIDDNSDVIGEGEFADISREQERDLEKMLTETAYQWAAKHKINLEAWAFGAVRNEYTLPAEQVPNKYARTKNESEGA